MPFLALLFPLALLFADAAFWSFVAGAAFGSAGAAPEFCVAAGAGLFWSALFCAIICGGLALPLDEPALESGVVLGVLGVALGEDEEPFAPVVELLSCCPLMEPL